MRSFAFSLVTGLCVAIFTYWSDSCLKIGALYAVIAGAVIFFLLTGSVPSSKRVSVKVRLPGAQLYPTLAWAASIVLVALSSKWAGALYLSWSTLGLLGWFGLGASVVVTSFMPGLTISDLLSKGHYPGAFRFSSAVLYSVLLTASIAFISLEMFGSLGTPTVDLILGASTALLAYHVYRLVDSDWLASQRVTIDSIDVALILLLALILLAVASVNFPNTLVPTYDQWFDFGQSLRAISGSLFKFIPSYYWLYLYVGGALVTSPLPYVNTFLVLIPLIAVLPAISFFSVCRTYCSRKVAVVATTIFSLFSGFGGLYVDYLRIFGGHGLMSAIGTASGATFNILDGANGFPLFLVAESIGISALFAMLALALTPSPGGPRRAVEFGLLFSLGFLFHVAESLAFIPIFIVLMLSVPAVRRNSQSASVGVISGVLAALIIDLSSARGVYLLLSPLSLYNLLLYGSATLLALLSFVPPLFNLVEKKLRFLYVFARRLARPLLVTISLLTVFCIVVWLVVPRAPYVATLYTQFPFFMYPISLGVALFMALLAQGIDSVKNRIPTEACALSLGIIAISFISERLESNLGSTATPAYPPYRVVGEFMWIGISILAAFGLVFLLERLSASNSRLSHSRAKRIVIVSLVMALFVGGTASQTYNVVGRSSPATAPSGVDLGLLEYLNNNATLESAVAAPGILSNTVQDFSPQFTIPAYSDLFFNTTSFEILSDFMNSSPYSQYAKSPIRYVLLPQDYTLSSSSALSFLLGCSKVVYEDKSVMLFELPQFSSPSAGSSTGFMVNGNNENLPTQIETLLSLNFLNYTILRGQDIPSKTNLIFLGDINQTEYSTQMLQYLRDTEHKIIVLDFSGTEGIFSQVLGISSARTSLPCDAASLSSTTVVFGTNLECVPHTTDRSSVTVVGRYSWSGGPVAALAFADQYGNSTIELLELQPLAVPLPDKPGGQPSESLRTLMGLVTGNLPHSPSGPVLQAMAVAKGNIELQGTVNMSSYSAVVPAFSGQSQGIGYRNSNPSSDSLTSDSPSSIQAIAGIGNIQPRFDALLENATGTLTDGSASGDSVFLSNCTILTLVNFGSYRVSTYQAEPSTQQAKAEGYVNTTLTVGSRMVYSLHSHSESLMTVEFSNDTVRQFLVVGGTTVLDLMAGNLLVAVASPELSTSDGVRIADAYFTWPYDIYSPWAFLTASGAVSFEIAASDGVFTILNGFSTTGGVNVIYNRSPFQEFNLPWTSILGSLAFIMFDIFAALWVGLETRWAWNRDRASRLVPVRGP